VKLTKELVEKIEQWKGYGFRPSDSVRLALSLLPSSPDDIRTGFNSTPLKLRPLHGEYLQIDLKDEKVVLRNLQEW